MTNDLTTEQKREYLRLLVSEGLEAANAYLDTIRPRRMVFNSPEDLKEYEKQIGKPITWWAIILNR